MKNVLSILLLLLVFTACKDGKKEGEDKMENGENSSEMASDSAMDSSEENMAMAYPSELTNVFKAHGGMDVWNKMNNLCFEMDGNSGEEVHTISLKDRHSKIETDDWSIGYDGNDVWLQENEKDTYKGNAHFYHNLMFYFYAMPFVLGDQGINYEMMQPAELDGKMYNAIKVSYDSGVGDSPKDQYVLYVNPETNTMEWLGYTVTYMDNKKSDDWHFIKYDKWEKVNGLLLPKKLTWYNVKDGKPTDERNDLRFNKITVTETQLNHSVFDKPEGAKVVARN